MKRLILLAVVALATAMVAVSAGASTPTVQVTKAGFTPQSATVNVGDTVTWHNADTANHQIVADDGSFASPVLHADQSYSHTLPISSITIHLIGILNNLSISLLYDSI